MAGTTHGESENRELPARKQNGATSAPAKYLGDVRSAWVLPTLLGLSCLVFVALLYLTSYVNFFYDEWDFVSYDRAWQLNLLWLGHNEHWSTIPILVWKLLFVVVGIRSHIPYEAALLATHVGAVLLLFILIRRRSGDLPAFAAALILLVLGSGGTDIVWAFQIGFVGSVAFGLLAMVLLEGDPPFPRRLLPVSGALLGSLMCSGAGVAFLIAVAVELLFDPRRRRFLLALVVPVVAFAEWFLAFGAGLPGTPGAPCPTCRAEGFSADLQTGASGLTYARTLGTFVASGVSASAGGISGFAELGSLTVIGLAGFIVLQWKGNRIHWQVGLVTGVVAWFALVGLGRAEQGPGPGESRYVYVGVVFLLPLIAHAARLLPWNQLSRPVLVTGLALCLFGNIVQLRDAALARASLTPIENAELQTVEVFRGAPDMALNRGLDDQLMPQLNAGSYLDAVRQLGSPVAPASLDTLRQLQPEAVDRVMVNLFGGALTVTPDPSRSTQNLNCRNIDSSVGAVMDFVVPNGQSIMLQSSLSGDAFLFLSYLGPPSSQPTTHVRLSSTTPEWIQLPNTGQLIDWLLRVRSTSIGLVKSCAPTDPRVAENANVYTAKADSGPLDPGWSSVLDPNAYDGHAVRAAHGTFESYRNAIMGSTITPAPGQYDVWFSVKVASPAASTPEMTLGIWDDQARRWLASNIIAPSSARRAYTWIKVVSGVTPTDGHTIHFLASYALRLGTDWYVSDAVMVRVPA